MKAALIELPVVVVVIAILAAMLLPALNKARAGAGKVTCINSHKQPALTMLSYIDDNDGRTMGGLLVDPYGKTWRFKLAEYQMGREGSAAADYIKAANMLVKCPAAIAGGLAYPELGAASAIPTSPTKRVRATTGTSGPAASAKAEPPAR